MIYRDFMLGGYMIWYYFGAGDNLERLFKKKQTNDYIKSYIE